MFLLCKTQLNILPFLARGYTDKQIGEKLNLSTTTVSFYVSRMIRNNKFNNRTRLANNYLQHKHLFILRPRKSRKIKDKSEISSR